MEQIPRVPYENLSTLQEAVLLVIIQASIYISVHRQTDEDINKLRIYIRMYYWALGGGPCVSQRCQPASPGPAPSTPGASSPRRPGSKELSLGAAIPRSP